MKPLAAQLRQDTEATCYSDARLLRDIAAAEEDVRLGRELPLAEAKQLLEQKWRDKAAKGFDQLDRGDSVEMDRALFTNHFRARRQAS